MNNEDLKMLDFVEFVTDKFTSNHEPWKYSRDTGTLKHIRYEGDYTGYNHWKKRLTRFFHWITVDYWKPKGLFKQLDEEKSFFKRLIEWPMNIRVWWKVSMRKEDNLPDGQVNGILTNWEGDGEYITMFCPYVGREVLKFLRAEPDNPYAQEIIRAMRETSELSWPTKEENNEEL